MTLNDLLNAANTAPETIEFDQVMAVLAENYEYSPAEFKNGLGDAQIINAAGTNEGSCKIFYFARLQGLDKKATLALFGRNYRDDVLGNPDGTNHQNIRNFMAFGMEGIEFAAEVLQPK